MIVEEIETQKRKVSELKLQYSHHEKILFNDESDQEEVKASNEMKEKYKESIKDYNKLLEQYTDKYKPYLKYIKQNEISKVNSIIKSFNSFFILMDNIATKYKAVYEKVITSLSQIRNEEDIEFYASNLSQAYKHDTFSVVNFEDHGRMYQLIDELIYGKSSPLKSHNSKKATKRDKSKIKLSLISPNELVEKVVFCCKELLENRSVASESVMEIFKSFDRLEVREAAAEILSSVKTRHVLDNYSAFESLGQIANYLLTMISLKEDSNLEYLCGIFNASFVMRGKRLTSNKNYELVPLRNLICANSIWAKAETWIRIIQYRLSQTLLQVSLAAISSDKENPRNKGAVSYTHLTLPTSDLV
eukprot:TRINITY_DN9741_c0_g1_i3.p1 TRINITY_DN9741_c0_g1~~TRINITY_DN9741_c0_g1_i3.p1  ORF type:complete len:360 (+),score=57.25 TRINITY_DN9741_c0_g1_i3:199-1278(+)